MKKNMPYLIGAGIILILIVILFSGNQKAKTITKTNTNSPPVSNQTNVTASPGSNPQDVVPGLYKNEINNTSTVKGFSISSAMVENNVDASGKVVDDHLEFKLTNTSGKELSNFELYYSVTDLVTNKKEGYFKPLTGFVLKNGQSQTIHLDNLSGEGHFSNNKNSIYYTSVNKLQFDVMVSSPGYKVQTVQVFKDAGGAEVKD